MRNIEVGKLERKYKNEQVCKTRLQGSFIFVQIVVYSDIEFKKYFEVFGCSKSILEYLRAARMLNIVVLLISEVQPAVNFTR